MVSQYYDSENISESMLGFRRATSTPGDHGAYDEECEKVLYNLERYASSFHTNESSPVG